MAQWALLLVGALRLLPNPARTMCVRGHCARRRHWCDTDNTDVNADVPLRVLALQPLGQEPSLLLVTDVNRVEEMLRGDGCESDERQS